MSPIKWVIGGVKVLYEGVVYLVSRFVKVIALIVIGAMAFGLFAILISTHFSLPYLNFVAPDPAITGYVAYYAGLIAFIIIPFVLMMMLIAKLIWRHRRINKYRYAFTSVWVVTAVIFIATASFTARNFVTQTSVQDTLSETTIGKDQKINVSIGKLEYPDGSLFFRFGHSFLSDGRLYNPEGIAMSFVPAKGDQMIVSKTTTARGRNHRSAVGNMFGPKHNLEINGLDISLDEYYTMDSHAKYRGQCYHYEVAIPIGTSVSIDRGSRIFRQRDLRRYHDTPKLWVMTDTGLQVQDSNDI